MGGAQRKTSATGCRLNLLMREVHCVNHDYGNLNLLYNLLLYNALPTLLYQLCSTTRNKCGTLNSLSSEVSSTNVETAPLPPTPLRHPQPPSLHPQ